MMEIVQCTQGEDDWRRARMGIPTASKFQAVLSPKAGKEGKMRLGYMMRLAGEIITGEPMPIDYSDANTERGKVMEAELRDKYAYLRRVDPEQVGFVRNGSKGASPDSLIGRKNGGAEIKSAFPHIVIETIFRDDIPPQHYAQVQGCIWVCETEWWDIVVGYTGMPLFIKTVPRDDPYIATLSRAVDEFNQELAQMVERVRRYG